MAADTLESLSREFDRLYAKDTSDGIEYGCRMGVLLERIATLRGRKYGAWLKERCIPRMRAQRFRDLARLRREDPRLLGDWAELGRSKLARLARVRPEDRARVLEEGGDRVCLLSPGRFDALTRPYLMDARPRPAPDPAARFRKKLAAARKLLHDALSTLPVPPSLPERRALVVELHGVCADANRLASHVLPGVRRPPRAPPAPPPVTAPPPPPTAVPSTAGGPSPRKPLAPTRLRTTTKRRTVRRPFSRRRPAGRAPPPSRVRPARA